MLDFEFLEFLRLVPPAYIATFLLRSRPVDHVARGLNVFTAPRNAITQVRGFILVGSTVILHVDRVDWPTPHPIGFPIASSFLCCLQTGVIPAASTKFMMFLARKTQPTL